MKLYYIYEKCRYGEILEKDEIKLLKNNINLFNVENSFQNTIDSLSMFNIKKHIIIINFRLMNIKLHFEEYDKKSDHGEYIELVFKPNDIERFELNLTDKESSFYYITLLNEFDFDQYLRSKIHRGPVPKKFIKSYESPPDIDIDIDINKEEDNGSMDYQNDESTLSPDLFDEDNGDESKLSPDLFDEDESPHLFDKYNLEGGNNYIKMKNFVHNY